MLVELSPDCSDAVLDACTELLVSQANEVLHSACGVVRLPENEVGDLKLLLFCFCYSSQELRQGCLVFQGLLDASLPKDLLDLLQGQAILALPRGHWWQRHWGLRPRG